MQHLHVPVSQLGLCLAVLAFASRAYAQAPKGNPQICPFTYVGRPDREALSCSKTAIAAREPCFYPENGIMALTLTWSTTMGPKDKFTIHGLWPNTCGNKNPGKGFSVAGVTPAVLEDKLKREYPALFKQMNTSWTSLKGPADYAAFWLHEYQDHGQYLTTVDPACYRNTGGGDTLKCSYVDYFTQTVNLATEDKYDVYKRLSSLGVTPVPEKQPQNDIKPEAMLEKLKEAYPNMGVTLSCESTVQGSLFEVKLFFQVKNRNTFEGFKPKVDPYKIVKCDRANIRFYRKTT